MLTITEIMYSTDTRRNIVNSEHVICIMHKVKCERFVLSLPEFCWMTTSTYFINEPIKIRKNLSQMTTSKIINHYWSIHNYLCVEVVLHEET